jgi:hypothetical protein
MSNALKQYIIEKKTAALYILSIEGTPKVPTHNVTRVKYTTHFPSIRAAFKDKPSETNQGKMYLSNNKKISNNNNEAYNLFSRILECTILYTTKAAVTGAQKIS